MFFLPHVLELGFTVAGAAFLFDGIVVRPFRTVVDAHTVADRTARGATGASLLVGYAIHSLFPAIDTYTLSALLDHHRASAYATFSASMMSFQALGSGAIGLAVSRGLGYTTVFCGLVVTLVAVAAVLVALHRAGLLPSGGVPGQTPTVSGD